MSKRIRITIIILAIFSLYTGWTAPFQKQVKAQRLPHALINKKDIAALRPGDLIFRRGRELVSDMVLATDPNGRYSHVGIIVYSSGKPYVVHAVPAERAGMADQVVKDSLEFFSSSERAQIVGVYRINDAKPEDTLHASQNAKKMVGMLFDNSFDLKNQDKLYCTELVWFAYKQAGIELVNQFDHLDTPVSSGDYILPSNILTRPKLQKIFEIEA